MSKIIISVFALFLLMFSVSAEAELTRWQFEEGGGNIVLDTSGNSRHGTVLGGRWQGGADARWGNYGFDFDNNNDQVQMITNFPTVSEFSIALWIKPDRNNEFDNIWLLTDNVNVSLALDYDGVSGDWNINYTDVNLTEQNLYLETFVPTTGTWYHLVLTVDLVTNAVTYFRDSVPIIGTTFPVPPNSYPPSSKIFTLGGYTSAFYDGDMDEFRIFDFKLNSTHIDQLNTFNTITLLSDEVPTTDPQIPTVNGTIETNLIDSYSPIEGSNVSIPFEISATMTQQVDNCDVYINNQLIYSIEDILAFSFEVTGDIPYGQNEYFIYCSIIDNNNVLNYDISNLTSFIINAPPPSTVVFKIEGSDFDVNNESLHILSPCPKEGYNVIGGYADKHKYRPEYNPNGIAFTRVIDGYANVNTYLGKHEFCLFNGVVNFDIENNRTTDYSISKVNGMLKLGEIDVPNNVTSTYVIRTELFEIYEMYNPKAYGLGWGALFIGLILGFSGFGLIAVGGRTGEGKLAIAGAILLLSAFGISFGGVVALLV